MKCLKKVVSFVASLAMMASVIPAAMAGTAVETLVINETFNGLSGVSELKSNWSPSALTTIEDGKDGEALYVGLDADTNNYKTIYTLDEPITSGIVKVSYSIKPGAGIYTLAQMSNGSKNYTMNALVDGDVDTNREKAIFSGTEGSDSSSCFQLGTKHDFDQWFDFETTIDLDNQEVWSTVTDEAGNTWSTPENNNQIAWGTGGTAMNSITNFFFQVWSNKDSGSYIDNFKVINITEDPFPIENITNGTASIANSGKSYSLGTSIISGEYVLTYDFYPTASGFVGMQYDGVEGGPTFYFMTFYKDGILRYGSPSDPSANMNADSKGSISTAINAANLHKAQIKFNLADGSSTCVVTDTVTGQSFTKNRNLMWSSSNGSHNGPSWTARDIENIHVRSWSSEATNVSNVCLARYYDAPDVTAADITLTDSDGNEQLMGEASITTKTIAIDFGKAMKEDTLSNRTIYLVPAGSEADEDSRISYIADYADGVYTMTLSKMLSAGSYTLVIGKDVATKEGGKNTDDLTFEITTVAPELGAEAAVCFEENFDELTSFGSGWITNAKTALVGDEVDGQMLETGLTSDVDNYITRYNLGTTITTGKYKFSFDVKPGENLTTNVQLYNNGGNKLYHIISAQPTNGMMYLGSTQKDGSNVLIDGTVAAGKWYHVDVELDMDTGDMSAKVVDEDGKETAATRSLKWSMNSGNGEVWENVKTDVRSLAFQVWSKKDSASHFDNIKFEEVITTPTVTAESVTLMKADGEEETSFTQASTLVNQIKVDFGTKMNTTTLTSDTVKLINTKTNTDLTYIPSYEDGVYTLNLPTVLDANTTYTLTISADVENAKNVALGNEANITITTTKGEAKAELQGVSLNSAKVTALSQLQKDDVINIEFDYANTTGVDKTIYVIVAYYGGNEMKRVDYITEPVNSEIIAETYKVKHTVLQTSDVEYIKVMSWDGFDTMKPLSESIIIR